jgi:NADH-quinone oxidoreductase subunit A
MPTDSFLPVVIFVFLGLVVVAMFYLPAVLLGPKVDNDVKLMPFECGNDPVGEPTVPFNPLFYQVALLFLVFDVEIAFLYPWAMVYLDVGRTGLVSMGVFVVVLFAALVYVVRKRVLRWV